MDDLVDKELDMLSEEEELWALPHFNENHEDDEDESSSHREEGKVSAIRGRVLGDSDSCSTCSFVKQ